MTVEELCEELLIGKNLAYKLLANGSIKGFRIGRIWKIPRQSLNHFIIQESKLESKTK